MNEPGAVGRLVRDYLAYRNQWPGNRWSQAQLARAVGLSQKHLSQILTEAVALSVRVAVRFEQVTQGDLDARTLLIASLDDQLPRARRLP